MVCEKCGGDLKKNMIERNYFCVSCGMKYSPLYLGDKMMKRAKKETPLAEYLRIFSELDWDRKKRVERELKK